MNLSEPLDGLASPVEAAVLRVLARADTGFSGRQVHALAGVGSTSSVHRALTHLVEVGVVGAEARPPAIIYRANRQHLLWPVVELGLEARSRFFDSVRSFCAEIVPEEVPEESVWTVVIYGSVARRDSHLDSDIDLCIVYPDGFDLDARADISYRLAAYAELVTGNETQVYSMERSEFRQRVAESDPLVVNVLADSIHIFGPPLSQTKRRVA